MLDLKAIRERCNAARVYAWSPEDRLLADCYELLSEIERVESENAKLREGLEEAEKVIDSLLGPYDQVKESYSKAESYRAKYPKGGE